MATAGRIDHVYRYPFASALSDDGGASRLQLATSASTDLSGISQSPGASSSSFPFFFEGKLLYPKNTAQFLTTVAKVVSTRYYMPTNMLQKILIQRDPVVTAGGGVLRFEGFSVCCSAYARVDLNPDSYSGDMVSGGTTNVDFNPPMRAALARVRDQDRLSVAVGPDSVMLKRGFEQVVERKVELPLRWLKGFVEIQSYQSSMQLRFRVGKLEAIRFLRSLPRNTQNRASFYVVQSGNGLRLSQAKTADAVPVSGLQRLQLLQDLAPIADSLSIYTNAAQTVSEWQLNCGPITISLTVTADVSRGFSGEGQVLSQLSERNEHHLAKVRAALKWQSIIDLEQLAKQCDIPSADVQQALARLGSRGLVGYDLQAGAYFHRELPFDLDLIEDMHPRLQAARKLVAMEGGVAIVSTGDVNGGMTEAKVRGTDAEHRVKLSANSITCTCPWYAKYQGARGPCKHVIAVQIATGNDDTDE